MAKPVSAFKRSSLLVAQQIKLETEFVFAAECKARPADVNYLIEKYGAHRNLVLIENRRVFRDGLMEFLRNRFPEFNIVVGDACQSCSTPCNADVIMVRAASAWLESPLLDPHLMALKERFPAHSILLMCESEKPSHMLVALKAGFGGYFPLTLSGEMLSGAIWLILAGSKFYPAVPHS